MKKSVSVSVLKPFEWKGTYYTDGQQMDLAVIDALVLHRKRLVALTKRKAKPAPPVVVVPEPELEPPKRRTYKRKDIQAETLASPIDIIHSDPEAEP